MAVLKNQRALETGQVSGSRLEIVVLHTEAKETVGALKMAADLACGLAPVRLVAIQQVPYPRPWTLHRLRLNFWRRIL